MIQRIRWLVYLHDNGNFIIHRYYSQTQIEDYQESPLVKSFTLIDVENRKEALQRGIKILTKSKRKI